MGGGLCQGKAALARGPAGPVECPSSRYGPMLGLALPPICILLVAAAFLTLERVAPGRELPHAPGWYGRAVLINMVQAAISFGTNRLWVDWMSGAALFHLAGLLNS